MSQSPRPARGGNRQALLDGALRCLQDRGYARTTARDIVAASGTNLGAIGYHFGSTESLLNQALAEGFRRWFEELALLVTEDEQADPLQGWARITAQLPATYERNRPLARAFIEALAQADHSEEIRAALADSYEQGRQSVARLLEPIIGDSAHRRVSASAVLALFDGLLLQWLVDPGHAPTGDDLLASFGGLGA